MDKKIKMLGATMRDYLFSLSPDGYIFESSYDFEKWYLKLIAKIPGLRFLVAKIFIKRGVAVMRVTKVDPKLAEEFVVDGWKVRNRSQRQDGTLWSAGGSILL